MLTLQVLKQIPCQKGDYKDPGAISLYRTIVSVCTCVHTFLSQCQKQVCCLSPDISEPATCCRAFSRPGSWFSHGSQQSHSPKAGAARCFFAERHKVDELDLILGNNIDCWHFSWQFLSMLRMSFFSLASARQRGGPTAEVIV